MPATAQPSRIDAEVLVSADPHVMEPANLLRERVPPALRDSAPAFPQHKVGESANLFGIDVARIAKAA